MPMPTEDDKAAGKKRDDAIAELVETVLRENPEVRTTNYRKPVYETAWELVEAFKAAGADLDKYKAEVARRRGIGYTIDPATAETTNWWADSKDPYKILGPQHYGGHVCRQHFARPPGASDRDWVHFSHLEQETRNALWVRDRGQLRPMPTEDDYKAANKKQDDAIAEFVETVLRENREVGATTYGRPVYENARKLVEAFKAAGAVFNYRLTDFEHDAEVERRRQIGLTIDPATAETAVWRPLCMDPYNVLDPQYYAGCEDTHWERFARHPGALDRDWVAFEDLPEATRNALDERDRAKTQTAAAGLGELSDETEKDDEQATSVTLGGVSVK